MSLLLGLALLACTAPAMRTDAAAPIDAAQAPLTATAGDIARGRAIALGRDANCVLCHGFPDTSVRFYGDVAPPLNGVGGRLSVAQLRFRIIDASRLNPATPMPPYYRVEGLAQVAEAYRGKPILTAQEVEDVVAYLATLK